MSPRSPTQSQDEEPPGAAPLTCVYKTGEPYIRHREVEAQIAEALNLPISEWPGRKWRLETLVHLIRLRGRDNDRTVLGKLTLAFLENAKPAVDRASRGFGTADTEEIHIKVADKLGDLLMQIVPTRTSEYLEIDAVTVIKQVTYAAIDFFFDNANQVRTGYDKSYFEVAQQTLKPYLDAGKLRTFSGKQEVLPGITGEIHPGHTPGSAFYTLQSKGERIVFVGDIVHVAAVQFPDPKITITYDEDENGAARVRAQTFASLAKSGDLIAVPHMPFPGFGHVRAAGGGGYDWVPVTYTNRAGQ